MKIDYIILSTYRNDHNFFGKKEIITKKFRKQGHIIHRQKGNFTKSNLSEETMSQKSLFETFVAILTGSPLLKNDLKSPDLALWSPEKW